MLNVLELFADAGTNTPPWCGPELEWTTAQLAGSPYVAAANGDATGLTVEFPFHRATPLLTVRTDGTLNYVTFLPNLAYTGQGGDLFNLVASMLRRARWFAEPSTATTGTPISAMEAGHSRSPPCSAL